MEQFSQKSGKILDVGCGTGLSGIALKQAGFINIDGCDLSQGMLDKSSQLNLYKKLFTCDLNSPPLNVPEETYDAVTAVSVFSFGHIQPDAVDELLRITKSDGYIIIGLNDHFYKEGSLTDKLDALEATGRLQILKREHGDHLPANDLKGWVLALKKC